MTVLMKVFQDDHPLLAFEALTWKEGGFLVKGLLISQFRTSLMVFEVKIKFESFAK